MDLPVIKFILVGLWVFASYLAPFVESQGDVIPGQESLPSSPPPPSSPPSPSPTQPPSPSPRSFGPSPAPESEPASAPAPALPSAKESLNFGKKIGLMFAGIAVILQVCVVAFLVIKRRQLLKNHGSRY